MSCQNCNCNELMNWRILTICAAIVFLTAISWIGYVQLTSKSRSDIMFELSVKHNIHPAVADCINRSWLQVAEFEMCRTIFERANLNMNDVSELRNDLNR